MGVIAQEVEKVFPEVVETAPDGYKSVAYPKLIAPIIEAIKEMFTDINQLKSDNAAMKAWICEKDPTAPFCQSK